MTIRTKADLIAIFHLGRLVTPTDMADLIDSLSALSIPTISQVYGIGDSLSANTWEPYLQTGLGSTWHLNSRGISGQPVTPLGADPGIAARFNYDVITPGDAKYVVVWCGINDVANSIAAATIEAALQGMYTAAHNAGIKVIACTITPWKGVVSYTAGKDIIRNDVNTWIMSSATNIDYRVDLESVVWDPADHASLLPAYDNGSHIHMTVAGYTAVANAIQAGATWTETSTTPSIGASGTSVQLNQDVRNTASPVFRGLAVDNTTLFVDNTNHRVGIGTITPARQLDITGDLAIAASSAVHIGSDLFLHTFKGAANDGHNTFLGVRSGNLTMGGATAGWGSYNTATGELTLEANTKGAYNTALGYGAMFHNTEGGNNIAIGGLSLNANLTGNQNVAVGKLSLQLNTSGSYNTAIGDSALTANLTAGSNTAVGASALTATTGANNTAVGAFAMNGNVGGVNNTALGGLALFTNASGNSNVAIGYSAGKYETGSGALYIDDRDRTNTAGDKANALIYGTFGAAAANQSLQFNAALMGFFAHAAAARPAKASHNNWASLSDLTAALAEIGIIDTA